MCCIVQYVLRHWLGTLVVVLSGPMQVVEYLTLGQETLAYHCKNISDVLTTLKSGLHVCVYVCVHLVYA